MGSRGTRSLDREARIEAVRAWLAEHPDGGIISFRKATGIKIASTLFWQIKNNRLAGETPRAPEPKKTDVVRAWLSQYPDGTYGECAAAMPFELARPLFYSTRQRMRRGPQKSKNKHGSSTNGTGNGVTHREEVLMEENQFLRWWNEGERRGWVSRLLEAEAKS